MSFSDLSGAGDAQGRTALGHAAAGGHDLDDLGAGPGIIAFDLAPFVGEVIAVDPEKGMLEEGRRMAAAHNVTNIEWRESDSTTLPAMDIGPVLLTVMGAAYHCNSTSSSIPAEQSS
ncbi:class I SAM-dependent methyltransferase [Streptomyces sioyaensis]|uniref:class I SAM-dependent methyltransferase n=1 Tax=Streptomyces sioyaensis TaxID=67364 RepID=UPI00369E4016